MDLSRFSGRVAVVTGAGGGLGSVISEELVRAGMVVAGVDVNVKPVEALAKRLEGPGPGKLHAVLGDVSRQEDLERVFQWVDANLGGVSVLINNAGKAALVSTKDIPFEDAAAVVNTNVLGVVASCTKAIQSMQKHGILDGHIINVSSTVGHPISVARGWVERFHTGVYTSSKHAVTALSQALRIELRDLHQQGYRIRVTNLSPGTVRTPLVKAETLPLLDNLLIEPSDIARAVRFVLASPPTVEISELTIQPTGEVW